MFLTEIFDSAVKIDVDVKSSDRCKMVFVVNGMEYVFSAYENEDEDKDGYPIWNIAFRAQKGDVSTHGITNTGSAAQVMATIIQCIKKWISMYPMVRTFFFTASDNEPSRVRLYNRMAQSVKLPGWKSETRPHKTKQEYYFHKTKT
jgi:hypothetical protein